MAKFDAAAVINIVEFVLSIIVTGLITGVLVALDIYKVQFVDCVVFGYLIINTIQVLTNFAFDQQLPKPVRLTISLLGCFMWLTASAFILETVDNTSYKKGAMYDRLISAGILGLANFVAYAVDSFFTYRISSS